MARILSHERARGNSGTVWGLRDETKSLREMNACILSLIVIDVNGHFLGTERLAVGCLDALEIRREDVVRIPDGNTLGKLAIVVGVDFPLGLLIFGATDLDLHPVDGTVVGSPHCAKDESVILGFLGVKMSGLGAEEKKERGR